MSKPRICLFFTGGTISMVVDPACGGPVPALSGAQILERVPGISELAEIRTVDFGLFPGPHMTPERMWDLMGKVRQVLNDPAVQSVVITHGTDTLEETAYLMERSLAPSKTVVFVGAMRNSSELGWDGPANLRSAIRFAASIESEGTGTVIVMNDQVIHALDGTKTHTESVDTFQSRDFGPLGVLEKDRIILPRSVQRRPPIPAERLESAVDIVALPSGSSGSLVTAAMAAGAKGLVLLGLGRGNIPESAIPAVEDAAKTGIPIVICSRCPRGRVLDTYAYTGSGRHLKRMGVILAGWLPAHKARLELMLAIGAGMDSSAIKDLFDDQ